MRLAGRIVQAALIGVLTTACGGSPEGATSSNTGLPDTLRVGVIPNIAPDDQRAKYDPLRAYLEDKLDVDVELFVATNYAGVVTALVSDQVDVAYLGGLTFVQAERQADVVPLVTEVDRETGTTKYYSAIVVKQEAPFQRTKDLIDAKASFAFGDISSTSGSLYPRMMITQAGAECDTRNLEDCPPLENVTFTGGHDATAKAVTEGSVDAGGLELRILHRLESDGAVEKGALRVIEQREVMGYPWVAREALGESGHDKIRQAFLEIKDPQLLDLLRAERYEAVSAGDYNEVRTQAERLGLLTE
jgi:phosphonate transport system substrate-binding protein